MSGHHTNLDEGGLKLLEHGRCGVWVGVELNRKQDFFVKRQDLAQPLGLGHIKAWMKRGEFTWTWWGFR